MHNASPWGFGTYYSTSPSLALDDSHAINSTDEAIRNGSHSFASIQGLKQILAVDVLTGKASQAAQDKTLRMPPLLGVAGKAILVLSARAVHLLP